MFANNTNIILVKSYLSESFLLIKGCSYDVASIKKIPRSISHTHSSNRILVSYSVYLFNLFLFNRPNREYSGGIFAAKNAAM